MTETRTAPRRADPAARRVPMDPRIRRRRVEVQRTEGRRRLHAVLGVLGGAALVAAGLGLTRSPLLDVDHVRVEGAEHTAAADLVRAARLDRHPPMIDVSGGAVARRARSLPWVRTARARREWPSTVRVVVTERSPVAVAPAEGGGWAAVDGTGRILAVTLPRDPDLPLVSGLPPAGRPGRRLAPEAADELVVAAALRPDLRARVTEIVTREGGVVEMNLRPAGTVRLGLAEDLDAKLVSAETVLAKADLRRLRILDVRVPEAPVLTRS